MIGKKHREIVAPPVKPATQIIRIQGLFLAYAIRFDTEKILYIYSKVTNIKLYPIIVNNEYTKCAYIFTRGQDGTVVTHSPPTSEVGGSNLVLNFGKVGSFLHMIGSL